MPLLLDLQFNNARVPSTNPTVEVYRSSDNYVLNWSNGNFIPHPSGSAHLGLMTELIDNPGLYRKDFNPQNYGQVQNPQIYYMQYRGTVPAGFVPSLLQNINIIKTEVHKFAIPSGIGVGGSPSTMIADFIQ